MSQSDSQDEEDWMSTDWANPEDVPSPEKIKLNDNKFHDAKTFPSNMESKPEKLPVTKSDAQVKTGMVNRMMLNDNKAGMVGLDKEKINKIIMEASKGSRFYENERKKEEQMTKRIEEQKIKLNQITEEQLKNGQIEADRLLEEFERARDLSRTIVHIDMDAFYAAVEMRDNPSLRNKPMAVGGMSMLSTSNYHARKFGVRAAMPGFIGKKLCPELVIVPTNFDKYTEISKQVRQVLADYDPNFSPMSLDEAYLDMTDHLSTRPDLADYERTVLCRKTDGCSTTLCNCDLNIVLKPQILQQKNKTVSEHTDVCPMCGKPYPEYDLVTFGTSAEDAVHEMRSRVEQKTRLTASAGIAPNTMLAKVCSDKNKPNGQYRIPAERDKVMEFIKDLPTRKISGIGKVSETMLNALGIFTCQDLYLQRATLYHLYSPISFNYFMRICIGIGSTFVERDSERKSMSTERTFSELSKPADLLSKCQELCEALSEDLKDEELKGKTVAIKIKTVEFEVKTRAHTLSDHTNESDIIFAAAKELLRTEIQTAAPKPLRLRLMGVRMSSLLHQNLCKKKQNTITGFIKRMATEKQKVKEKQEDTEEMINEKAKLMEKEEVKTFEDRKEIIECEEKVVDDNDSDTSEDDFLKDCNQCSRTRDEENNNTEKIEGHVDCDSIGERGIEFDLNIIDCSKEDQETLTDHHSKLKETSDLIQKIRKGLAEDDTNLSVNAEQTGFITVTDPENKLCDSSSENTQKESFTCPVCQKPIFCEDLTEFNQHIDICLNKNIVLDCTKQAHIEDKKQSLSPGKKKQKTGSKPKSKSKKGKILFSPISKSLSSKVNMDSSPKTNSSKQGEIITVPDSPEKEVLNNLVNLSDFNQVHTENASELQPHNVRNNPTRAESEPGFISGNSTIADSPAESSAVETVDKLPCGMVCPVCFMEQKGNNLDAFNEHVDTCLSKDAITQIVRHENSSAVMKSDPTTTRITPIFKKRAANCPPDDKQGKKQKVDSGNRTIDSFFKH